jgi:hypothetical protein
LDKCILERRSKTEEINLEFFLWHLVEFLLENSNFVEMVSRRNYIENFVSTLKEYCSKTERVSKSDAALLRIAIGGASPIDTPFNYIENVLRGDQQKFLHSFGRKEIEKLGFDYSKRPHNG